MHEEVTIPELTEVVARLSALLGPRQGGVEALEGGITNRNFRVNFGGSDYVVRLPGKRTELLGIDRKAECVATETAGELGIGPGVSAMLESRRASSRRSSSDGRWTAEDLAAPDQLAEVGRAASVSRFRHQSLHRLRSFGLVDEYAELARKHGRSHLRASIRHGPTPSASRRRSRATASTSRCPATTTCSPPTSCMTESGCRSSTGSTREWATATRSRQLRRQPLRRRPGDRAAGGVLRRRPTTGAATLKLFRFMSDFREAMWGVVQTGLSSSTSTSTSTRRSISTG